MKPLILSLTILLFLGVHADAQKAEKLSLSYYLPSTNYLSPVPTVEDVLGYPVGKWHISHDQLRIYIMAVANASNRVQVEEIGRTYEDRPLYNIYISSPENLTKMEATIEDYDQISDPSTAQNVDIDQLPAVVYQGYSIHGNESSGSNAAMLMLYHLAAGTSEEVERILKDCIVVIDPCMNPDGLNRFASWVNSHRNQTPNGDPAQVELNEPWPRGRTNHYWFDLNRDWLLLTHPESRARVRQFHRIKPLILTDHHEMGTNSTFFFQPGVPSRTNPNTPPLNQEITGIIGQYHARALDALGSLYFTKARFDDYYYGKGSTYPDGNGTIGILFEQASSRGHVQDSKNGVLTFPFTIRNQVATSLSTLRAAVDMRIELLEYRKWFYQEMKNRATASDLAGYLVTDSDTYTLNRFLDILKQHDISAYGLKKDISFQSQSYPAKKSFFVPLNQRQYLMVKTIFEDVHSFPDSIFYDVSTWTIPRAFDLTYTSVPKQQQRSITFNKTTIVKFEQPYANIDESNEDYAYMIDWSDYQTPTLAYHLLAQGIITKTTSSSLKVDGHTFTAGSIIIPLTQPKFSKQQITQWVDSLLVEFPCNAAKLSSGSLAEEKTLGGPNIKNLELPRVALVAGNGCGYADVGEFWHHLDIVRSIPVSVIDVSRINSTVLKRYNTLILANSNPALSQPGIEDLKKWVQQGGTLIATKRSIEWLTANQLVQSKRLPISKPSQSEEYESNEKVRGAQVLGGAIFEMKLDLTHPLCYGYDDNLLASFKRGQQAYEITANLWATPIQYTANPALSGYVPRGLEAVIANSAAVSIHQQGRGTIINMVDSPLFRGYWYGGHQLVANALFFGKLINNKTKQ